MYHKTEALGTIAASDATYGGDNDDDDHDHDHDHDDGLTC